MRKTALSPFAAAAVATAAVAVAASLAGCDLGTTAQCKLDSDCRKGTRCISGLCKPASSGGADAGTGSTDAGTGSQAGPDASTPGGADAGATGDGGFVCGEAQFELTDTQEVFTVPDRVTYMHVKAWGAGGNGEGVCPTDDSGLGGYTEAVFAVLPGQKLIVVVGKQGHADPTNADKLHFGFGSQGGGGLSGVFLGPDLIDENSFSKALIIAGGGGGAGVKRTGDPCCPGGTGNHPDSGGMPTFMGGAGLDDGVNGGGGGYHGGLGAGRGEAGTGGEGFVAPTAVSSKMLYSERATGLPPNTDDPDYDGQAGKGERPGLVVLRFLCHPPEIN